VRLTSHALALLCVSIIAVGQILFKCTANALRLAGTVWHVEVLGFASAALALYGLATPLWIALLQHAPLGRVYPYMALSFVLVAGAGWLVFGERVSFGYLIGLTLIVAGILVISRYA
jgi:drug/metabolite transporter (DMT)-like permease